MGLSPNLPAVKDAVARGLIPAPAPPPGCAEKEFLAHVVALAKACGWMAYHTHDSRRSEPGFPDLVLVKVGDNPRALFAELKTDEGTLTGGQRLWLDALNAAGVAACVWRPRDWAYIEAELRS